MSWEYLSQIVAKELESDLGKYKFTTNIGIVEKPAIHVFPPQPTNNRQVIGLEVIINKCPNFQRDLLLHRNENRSSIYSVYLIHHDKNKTAEKAAQKLLNKFPKATIFVIPQSDLNDEQIKIEIPFNNKVNLS